MARPKRRVRDPAAISNRAISALEQTRLQSSVSPLRSAASILGDRRLHHPEGIFRDAITFAGTKARIIVADPRPTKAQRKAGYGHPSQTRAVLAFAQPRRVLLCLRRAVRKEVIHALKHKRTGKGGSRKRERPRWTWQSLIRC